MPQVSEMPWFCTSLLFISLMFSMLVLISDLFDFKMGFSSPFVVLKYFVLI